MVTLPDVTSSTVTSLIRSQLSPIICSGNANLQRAQVLSGQVTGCLEAKSDVCMLTPALCLISMGRLEMLVRKVATRS